MERYSNKNKEKKKKLCEQKVMQNKKQEILKLFFFSNVPFYQK